MAQPGKETAMSKHIVDQQRERSEGARARQYTRVEREQGAAGPHARSEELHRRPAETPASGRRTEEFLRRDRAGKA
jgi:hypothetical protein